MEVEGPMQFDPCPQDYRPAEFEHVVAIRGTSRCQLDGWDQLYEHLDARESLFSESKNRIEQRFQVQKEAINSVFAREYTV